MGPRRFQGVFGVILGQSIEFPARSEGVTGGFLKVQELKCVAGDSKRFLGVFGAILVSFRGFSTSFIGVLSGSGRSQGRDRRI